MNARSVQSLKMALVISLAVFASPFRSPAQQADQPAPPPPPIPSEELPAGSQILAAGPVHEAFAKPVSMDPQAPIVVPKQPPPNLQEVPPAEKPDGAYIVWVPGYWAWDADRNDFIWVSGCWRNAPPNTYWVPGHWLQVDTGWEWIGGFWKPMSDQPQQELEYLPAPPPEFEADASGPPPQPDDTWVPGCWYWQDGQYIPRHGYWIAPQLGWVWVPSHFAWTPRGYIFAGGHWDHDLDDRGVLFSPAYFPPDVRVSAGFVFSPSICIDLGMLRLNLFAYPAYRHYYFGDYYDDRYRHLGIYPWYQCQTVHAWYDPLFAYDRWHLGRSDPHWVADQQRGFEQRRANRDMRPARTFTEQQAQMARLPANRRPERPLAESIKTYASSTATPGKFERLTNAERQQVAVKSTEVHQLRQQRGTWERPATTASPVAQRGPATEARPTPETRANPPVVRPTPAPSKEVRPVQVIRPPPVRVTAPEREVVNNPHSAPKPSESRYIAKEPPSHPAEERSRTEPTPSRGSAEPNSQRKQQ
ncbi:MAG TPA: hypothetical protein VMV72_16970 [Verrucomicrobiae bacterium]|nr:hypothetical protein [Verrucomicrobiae bacterium]